MIRGSACRPRWARSATRRAARCSSAAAGAGCQPPAAEHRPSSTPRWPGCSGRPSRRVGLIRCTAPRWAGSSSCCWRRDRGRRGGVHHRRYRCHTPVEPMAIARIRARSPPLNPSPDPRQHTARPLTRRQRPPGPCPGRALASPWKPGRASPSGWAGPDRVPALGGRVDRDPGGPGVPRRLGGPGPWLLDPGLGMIATLRG